MIDIQKMNPMRSPQWRLERAVKLAENKPRALKPRKSDDHYVRAYRRFLLGLHAAGGDSDKEHELLLDQPAVYFAHAIHFHPDREWSAMLQAWILTREDDEQLAKRMSTSMEVIRYYEKIFFNVRDRFENSNWMLKTIMGHIATRTANKNDSITDDQRFFLFRLFAFYGGSLVLDAMLTGMSERVPLRNHSDLREWFQNTLTGLIHMRSAMSARVFESSKWNTMQLMELGVTLIRNQEEEDGTQSDTDRRVFEMLQNIKWSKTGKPAENLPDPLRLTSAIEPRAMESVALVNGTVPESLVIDEGRVQMDRLGGTKPTEEVVLEGATE